MDALIENLLAGLKGTEYQKQMERVSRKPMSNYTTQFFDEAGHMKNADVTAYRNYVLKNGPFIDVPDLPKCNNKAAKVRQVGNRLYLKKDYNEALNKYNESICWAETGSEDLGIGYANRSAIYYEQEEYQYAIANIALAKKHNYPQRLLSKLLAREQNCLEKIRNGQSKFTIPPIRMPMNVDVNPRIPHLAKGIRMGQIAGYGRSMIAERDFKAGDVILHETPMLTSVSPELKYLNCNYCSIENFHSLIPCPNCVSVMYCDEECLEKGTSFHRYECGISEKLHHISYGSSRVYMGPRMFFYGLSLFDNLEEMMKFCSTHDRTGANPLTLDYTNDCRLEEFKIFHQVKLPTSNFLYEDSFRFYAAVYYSVYINHPLVKSIFTNQETKNFMLRAMLDYMRIIGFLVIGRSENFTNQLQSLASVFNHSCDPNTVASYRSGQLKVIVLRPISKGEQIFISYGPLYDKHSDSERKQIMAMFHFDCVCNICDRKKYKSWLLSGKRTPPIPRKHMTVLQKVVEGDNDAAKLNAMQQFVQRYACHHPGEDIDSAINMYRSLLNITIMVETDALLRGKIAKGI
ncbi:SET and MYND domain-containing protein DDB_G0273589-like [Topomyia yanbarensis]|uniref:SET and MYND domain-containing protein DDB_G0273589-like n=1 Tax=Topomyia yanbarensis TaxID=2498891 RepID=UPI00273BCEDC|nr:SET and MYND domain-containing protein DDB_G0273589-like [Topomyia yanbarensis]